MTVEDYLARKSFPDEVYRNNYFIDIHTTPEEAGQVRSGETLFVEERFERYKDGESHGVPYRCLTPKGLKNVLVAGRSISTDRITQGSTRVMPSCLCMGEAAGMAAKFAVDMAEADVHRVDTDRLRDRLREEGAYLP
ncbi:MAG: hypothetical protein BGN88_05065 [Clostridiales bacterium 43-6]|nr:MAG: hypothetical protein BGN88_05065 [Clostridiales bacterium 43-6]